MRRAARTAAPMPALALALALAAGAAPVAAKAPALTVMSFNVRLPLASDGANDWPRRRALAIATIRKAAPDIIGTQELHKAQGDDIVAGLPDYAWFGRDRRGGHADEHMGIFYAKDRWTLAAQGDFWLSDTPAVPGSISWGHPYPRMVGWGRFCAKALPARCFTLFDTHLPYRVDDDAARLRGAQLIAARVRAVEGPVVVTGDFNTIPASAAHAALAGVLTDSWQVAWKRKGPAGTFHGFTGKPGDRIDWIWTRGLVPLRVTVLDDHQGPLYPSDHFPVVAEIDWPHKQ